MIRVPTHREPTHPGEMLLEDFFYPYGYYPKGAIKRDSCSIPENKRNC